MKMLNAWTLELDEPEVAIAEIMAQLDLDKNLLSRSAGFITCSYDFIETGMVMALCEALPFEITGCTTFTNANNEEAGTMLLCLTVLTADDCSFATALSPVLKGDVNQHLMEAYDTAAAKLDGPPALVLAFVPMMDSLGGGLIIHALNEVVMGTPIFGTTACDFDTAQYTNSYTIFNGRHERDRLPMLLISGNVNPRFVVAATSEQNLRKQHAVITDSEGSILKKVNDMRARDYFESIGLIQGDSEKGLSSVPFMVNYNDGTQSLARAIYSLSEDGSAVCGGRMPKGATLSIGRMDEADILLTAEQSLTTLLKNPDLCGIITFPCLGRNLILGMDFFREIDRVREIVPEALPFHLAYSGGEVCPVYDGQGNPVNRFHNFTFIACAL